jgi:hypothetical protein
MCEEVCPRGIRFWPETHRITVYILAAIALQKTGSPAMPHAFERIFLCQLAGPLLQPATGGSAVAHRPLSGNSADAQAPK